MYINYEVAYLVGTIAIAIGLLVISIINSPEEEE